LKELASGEERTGERKPVCNEESLVEEKLVSALSQAQLETKKESRPVTLLFRGPLAVEKVHQV